MQESKQFQKYCANCGAPLSAGTKFCAKCGSKQPTQEDNASSTPFTSMKKGKSVHTMFIVWGWVCAVVSLFIPIIGAGGIVFGVLLIKRQRVSAAIPLLVCSAIFIMLGLTGFSNGFFNAL